MCTNVNRLQSTDNLFLTVYQALYQFLHKHYHHNSPEKQSLFYRWENRRPEITQAGDSNKNLNSVLVETKTHCAKTNVLKTEVSWNQFRINWINRINFKQGSWALFKKNRIEKISTGIVHNRGKDCVMKLVLVNDVKQITYQGSGQKLFQSHWPTPII